MIDLFVNGETRQTTPGQTLSGLLAALGLDGEKVAVELNRRIVPKAEWPQTCLEAGSEVEIVHFVGGG